MEQLLELARERKLDRIGATYAVVAWILVQAASIALPAFAAPAWALRWLIMVAMAGFPVVLLLAWMAPQRAAHATAARPFDRRDGLLLGLIALVAVLLVVQLTLGFSGKGAAPVAPSPPATNASSIAVLPFANLSGNPSQGYFSDGITDQLISELARTPSLRVAARTSSFAFRGKDVDVKAIAKTLNVRTVLEGSVREDGNRVRIAAELVDATNGFQIWSETYDRDLTNILALQDEIAGAIARALSKRFWGRVAATRPVDRVRIDPEAYKFYLQGQFYLAQRTRQGVARSIELFEKVAKLAPNYADGFAAIADARSVSALNFAVLSDIAPAEAAVQKALALDRNNSTALLVNARISLLRWKWRQAGADLKRLEDLHVNSATVWRTRAVFFDYMALPELARPAEEHAVQLDPLSFIDHYNLALYMMMAKHYDEALRIADVADALQPGNPELLSLRCQVATMRDRVEDARRIQKQLLAMSRAGEPPADAAACGFYLMVAEKNFTEAHKVADQAAASFPASGISATDIGVGYATANDIESAIKWFRRSYELRDPQMPRVAFSDHNLAKLFADPRWKALRSQPPIRDWEDARREIATQFQTGE